MGVSWMTPTRLVEHLLVMEKMDLHKVGSKDEDYKPRDNSSLRAVTVGSSGSFPVILQIEENGGGLGSVDLQSMHRCTLIYSLSFSSQCQKIFLVNIAQIDYYTSLLKCSCGEINIYERATLICIQNVFLDVTLFFIT